MRRSSQLVVGRATSAFVWLFLAALLFATACRRPNAPSGQTPPAATDAATEDDLDFSELIDEENNPTQEDQADATSQKDLPPFEVGRLSVAPQPPVRKADETEEDEEIVISPAKAGHWCMATRELIAHDADYAGRLTTFVSAGGMRPKFLPNSRYAMRSARPAALPKGRARLASIDFLLPYYDDRQPSATVSGDLSGAIAGMQDGFALLREHEQFLVVLAAEPTTHGFWTMCDSARPWHGDFQAYAGEETLFADPNSLESRADSKLRESESKRDTYYRVEIPAVTSSNPPPLPSSPLAWTTIAYIVWDDLDPELLSREQRQAMVDWLLWGGQIVIAGPNSLESLRGSFLEPYLPASAGKATELTSEMLQPLNEKFSNAFTSLEGESRGGPLPPLSRVDPSQPVSGAVLKPGEEADVLLRDSQGEPLVVERRCGRGRTVVTAFRITEPAINRDWRHFDNFANACLLRRPPRAYLDTGLAPRVDWANQPGRRFDGALLSRVRYFTRDAETWQNYAAAAGEFNRFGAAVTRQLQIEAAGTIPYGNPFGFGGGYGGPSLNDMSQSEPRRGYGVWNDNSVVPAAARETLLESTGIEIPSADFVLWVLAGYLFFLVPVNYLFFRILNRLEWAWISVPIMAIGAAAIVIKLAQLEIGFVRSAEEIAVCEMQGGYSRAHISRFDTLYTSLGTNFSVAFDDGGACAAPFAPDAAFTPQVGASPIVAEFYRDGRKTELAGVRILSNDADMVRAEHMLDMGGAVSLQSLVGGAVSVVNETEYELRQCGLFRATDWGRADDDAPTIEACWLGDLAAGEVGTGRLVESDISQRGDPLFPEWRRRPASDEQLDLSSLIELAVYDHALPPGAIRLIGRISERLPGMTISPDPSQKSGETLVVVNLYFPAESDPVSDVNHLGVAIESFQQRLSAPLFQ